MENPPIPQPRLPLAVWLHYLERLHIILINLGLERVSYVAAGLNLRCPAPSVITGDGTNRKDHTCRLLEAIVLTNSMQIGVYSSPHLLRHSERVGIQGDKLPEAAYSEALTVIKASYGATSLSYFECGTLTALKRFWQAALDVVVLEVGGGAWTPAISLPPTSP